MPYTIRPYKKGEELYVARLHEKLYSEEYSWGPAFTVYAAKIALDFAKAEKNERQELFVAESCGRLFGCIMLCETEDPLTAQLRLFAVEKECRGKGVGSALLKALMDKAHEAGYKKMILWTASPLVSAIRQYEKLGFRETESVENTTWRTDGGSLYEIKMEMDLSY